MRSPEFGTVLHWRPPDIHIFHTDPSLINMSLKSVLSDLCDSYLDMQAFEVRDWVSELAYTVHRTQGVHLLGDNPVLHIHPVIVLEKRRQMVNVIFYISISLTLNKEAYVS